MTLSDNEKRLIIATVSLVAGASTAKIYNCPDQNNIIQCPLSLVMISVAFLCSLMIGVSRLRGTRAHHLFTSLNDQVTHLPETNKEPLSNRQIIFDRLRGLHNSSKHIKLPARPQHQNYNTMQLQV